MDRNDYYGGAAASLNLNQVGIRSLIHFVRSMNCVGARVHVCSCLQMSIVI